jgi:hypothetical protein
MPTLSDNDERIAKLADKAARLVTPLVEDPVDCLLVISTMAASMSKALAMMNIGYCSSSAMCMHIDYALVTLKRINNIENEYKPEPEPASYV